MQLKFGVSLYILSIFTLIALNSGCNGVKSGGASFGSLNISPPAPTTPPPPVTSAPDGSSNGITSDDYFYVGVDSSDDAIFHVHKDTDFNESCSIKNDVIANTDINCIVDIPEADLFAKKLSLKHNVPKGGMCRYLVRYPYYFYNHEVGIGPANLNSTTTITRNASGDITNVVHACTIDSVIYPGCTGMPDSVADINNNDLSFKCIYDKSSAGKPNCCSGEYAWTKTVIDGTTQVSNLTGSWNSSSNPDDLSKFPNDCYGGSGNVDPLKAQAGTAEELRAGIIEFAKNGLKYNYEITPPAKLKPNIPRTSRASMHIANFAGGPTTAALGMVNVSHTHTGFINNTPFYQVNDPYYVAPVDDRSGDLIAAAHGSYEYLCLDEAYEIKHRIRVYIRDWDVKADFDAYISSKGLIEVPDRAVTDVSPGNCVGAVAGYPCNKFGDADNFIIELVTLGIMVGPSYDTTNITKRGQYFPKINY